MRVAFNLSFTVERSEYFDVEYKYFHTSPESDWYLYISKIFECLALKTIR